MHNTKKNIGNLNNSKTRLFVLYSQNYAARAQPIPFNTPKDLYSNQATQKNTCQIFVPKKISPWGRNECVTTEPQRTSAGRLQPQVMLILKKIAAHN